jgi:hypothetical protein
VGRVAFKRRVTPLDGNHVFALSSCIAPFHLPFSHRSASRIFIRQPGCIPSPVVTQDGDHQLDSGEKRTGL